MTLALVALALAGPMTPASVPDAAATVLVEMVQTAPGQPPVGFRITPDGKWSDLDGTWSSRTTLDAAALGIASRAVGAVGDVQVPAARVTDAIGVTTWRFGATRVVVPDGVSVPALSALYTTLQSLPDAETAGSTWTVDGVPHEVTCAATSSPALTRVTQLLSRAAGPGATLDLPADPRLVVVWRELGQVSRVLVTRDGRVGAGDGEAGPLRLTGTLSRADQAQLEQALAGVDWAGVCGTAGR